MNSKMEDEQANKLQQRLYRSIFFLKRVKKLLHILLFAHFYSLNIKVMTFSTQFCTVWVKAAMPALSFQLGRVKSLSDTPDRVTEMFRGAVCTCWAACPASRECTTLTQLAVLTQGALPSSGTDRIFPHHCKYFPVNTTLVQWMLDQPGSEYWEDNSNQHHLGISLAFSFQEIWFYCMAGRGAQHLTQLHCKISKESWGSTKGLLWMVEFLRFIASDQQAGLVWAMLNTGKEKQLYLCCWRVWPVSLGSPQSHCLLMALLTWSWTNISNSSSCHNSHPQQQSHFSTNSLFTRWTIAPIYQQHFRFLVKNFFLNVFYWVT